MSLIKTLRGLALAVATGFVSICSAATTHYVCDCQTGADPACIAGSSGGSDTAASPKQLPSQVTLGVSDTLLFCKGGAWTALASITGSGGTSTTRQFPWTAPAVFSSYSSPNFSSTAVPSLTFAGTAFDLNQVNYVEVANLKTTGQGTGVANTRGVVPTASIGTYIHDMEITQFTVGVLISDGNNSNRVSDVILLNSNIHHNTDLGIEGCGNRIWIEGNTFDTNGSASHGVLDHNIYMGGGATQCDVTVIRGNTLTNNRKYDGATCGSVAMVGHGWITNMTVEDNVITEAATDGNCYGMSFGGNTGTSSPPNPQNFSNLVIRRNRVTIGGLTGIGIHVRSAPYAEITDNVIEHTNGTSDQYFYCISTDDADPTVSRGDVYGHDLKIVNNSCKMTFNTATPSIANTALISAGSHGTGGDVIANNVVWMTNSGSATMRVMELNGRNRATSFTNISNNIGFNAAGTTQWDAVNATPGAASESGSSIADPNFATFPAVNVGSAVINNGNATYASRVPYGKGYPVSARDIGAAEFGATPSQSPLGSAMGRVR